MHKSLIIKYVLQHGFVIHFQIRYRMIHFKYTRARITPQINSPTMQKGEQQVNHAKPQIFLHSQD